MIAKHNSLEDTLDSVPFCPAVVKGSTESEE